MRSGPSVIAIGTRAHPSPHPKLPRRRSELSDLHVTHQLQAKGSELSVRTDVCLAVLTPTRRVCGSRGRAEHRMRKRSPQALQWLMPGSLRILVRPRPRDVRAPSRKIREARPTDLRVVEDMRAPSNPTVITIVPPRLNRHRTCHRLLLNP